MLDVVAALFFLVALRLFFITFRSALVDVFKAFGELVEWLEARRLGPPSTSLALPVPVRWEMDDEQKATAALHAKVRDLELQVATLLPAAPPARGTPSTLAPAPFDVVPGRPVVRPPPLPAPVGSTTICR